VEKGHRVMLNAVSKPEEIKTASLKQLYEDAAEVQGQIVYELPPESFFRDACTAVDLVFGCNGCTAEWLYLCEGNRDKYRTAPLHGDGLCSGIYRGYLPTDAGAVCGDNRKVSLY